MVGWELDREGVQPVGFRIPEFQELKSRWVLKGLRNVDAFIHHLRTSLVRWKLIGHQYPYGFIKRPCTLNSTNAAWLAAHSCGDVREPLFVHFAD